MVLLNLLVKPVWIFGIDLQVQQLTGYEAYGHYFALMNLTLMFNFLLDLGISAHFNREMARTKMADNALMQASLNAKCWLSFLYAIVVLLVAVFSNIRDLSLLFLLLLLQTAYSLLLFIRAYLTAAQLFRLESFISVIDKLFVIISVGLLLLFPMITGPVTIQRFVWMQLAGAFLAIGTGIFFLRRHNYHFSLQPGRRFPGNILQTSLPFALNIFLMSLLMRADGFLLERLHPAGAGQAGIYAAGYRLLDAFNMFGYLVAAFLLPFIARHWPDIQGFRKVTGFSTQLLLVPALVAAAFALAAPDFIAETLYGRQAAQTIPVIRILLLALPGLALVQIHGTVLTATGDIRFFLRMSLMATLTSFLFNVLLIPTRGAVAAAGIAVFTLTLYGLALAVRSHRRTGIVFRRSEGFFYAFIGGLSWGICMLAVKVGVGALPGLLLAATLSILLCWRYSGLTRAELAVFLKGK